MAVLVIAPNERPNIWASYLRELAPELDIRIWPDTGDPDKIIYAVAWNPPAGILASFTNLKIIFSLGAGVDHLFKDPDFPIEVTVSRVIDPYLTAGMREYVLLHVLKYHKNQPELDKQQKKHIWNSRENERLQSDERNIGILGLGILGTECAKSLAALDFNVKGWSRSLKVIPDITCLTGLSGLNHLLNSSSILICLLPLTKDTEGILNFSLFSKLPKGAYLINAARGNHLIEKDLITCLDSGQLTHATLDVFRKEPLPKEHVFWDHDKITVTPHNASITDPRTVVYQILENIQRHLNAKPISNTVDIINGY